LFPETWRSALILLQHRQSIARPRSRTHYVLPTENPGFPQGVQHLAGRTCSASATASHLSHPQQKKGLSSAAGPLPVKISQKPPVMWVSLRETQPPNNPPPRPKWLARGWTGGVCNVPRYFCVWWDLRADRRICLSLSVLVFVLSLPWEVKDPSRPVQTIWLREDRSPSSFPPSRVKPRPEDVSLPQSHPQQFPWASKLP